MIIRAFRTLHNYLDITHKAVDHTQGRYGSGSLQSLILGQSIQSLEDGVYLTLLQ